MRSMVNHTLKDVQVNCLETQTCYALNNFKGPLELIQCQVFGVAQETTHKAREDIDVLFIVEFAVKSLFTELYSIVLDKLLCKIFLSLWSVPLVYFMGRIT